MAAPILQMNARERRLLSVLGFVGLVVLLLAIPFGLEALVRSSASDNEELRQALSDVQDARSTVRDRQAKRDATVARYAKKPPELPSFLEQSARAVKLEVTDSTPMQDVPHGKRYVEHGANVRLKKTGMLALARFIESIEKSGYPVVVSRLGIRKRSGEADSYDVELGVTSYERLAQVAPTGPAGSSTGTSGGAGGKP
jgi:general secretion pathway protein M